MASFSDNSQQLGNFNPYIQQLPLDEMIHVGTQKQKAYDEGVQKIQTNIDNVAGMDVIRDVDKAYLQSKVNELSSNLRTVAAGDFSNFQLVNSVSGMTNNIVKDKNVQNAVSSTMRFRKEQAAQEQANKEGKGSVSNDWDFGNQTSSWLNSSDVKQAFTGKYTPYTNYKKNALEVIKALTKDESITDNDLAFDSKGNLTIADAITRTKLSGISPEKIQQALLSTLTPNDFKQMEIDGRYSYANIPPEKFVERINTSFKEKYDAFQNQKDVLINAMDSTSSLSEKQKLKEQVDNIDKTMSNIKSEYNNISSTFADGDVESAKARLHTADFMNGFSKAFSYTQTSQTKEDSPAAKIEMERQKLNQQWKQFEIESAQKERFQNQDAALKWEDIKTKKEANAIAKTAAEGYGSLGMPTDENDKPIVDVTKFVADNNKQINDAELQEKDFYTSQGKNKAWLTQQHDAYLKNQPVDIAVKQYFQRSEQVQKDIRTKQTLVANLRKEAEKENGNVYKLIPKGETNLIYTTSTRQKYEYTPKDIVDFNDKFNNSIRKVTSFGGRGAPGISYDQKILESLSNKERELANIFLKNDRGQSLYPAEKVMLEKAQKMNKLANIPFQQTIKKINDQVNKGLEERLIYNQPGSHGIPLNNAEQKSTFINGVVGPMIDIANAHNGKIGDSDVSVDDLIAFSKDPKSAYISVAEGSYESPTKYKVTVLGGGKANPTSFNITPEQKKGVFKGRFEKTPEMQAATPYINQINYMKKGKAAGKSTAWDGSPVTTLTNAYMNNTDFPAVSHYGIAANWVTMDGGQSYYINAKFYDQESKTWSQNISFAGPDGPVPANTMSTVTNGLTDEVIYEKLHGKPATVNDIKRVSQASQKPFRNAR